MNPIRNWWRARLEARRTRLVTMSGARRRVARGAKYLDDAAPGWADGIDPWSLDLAHGDTCILGQLHGSFTIGLGRAGLFSLSSAPRASFSPVDLGFHCIQGVCDAVQEQDYEYLNQAWHEEIERRCGRSEAASTAVVHPSNNVRHATGSGDGAAIAAVDLSVPTWRS